MKNKQNGITLIALVITIIVLLILAGVSIMTLAGDNGLLTRTTSAKAKTEQAGVMENIRLAYQNALIGKYANNESNAQIAEQIDKDLEAIYGENTVTVEESEGIYTVTTPDGTYTIGENGNISRKAGITLKQAGTAVQSIKVQIVNGEAHAETLTAEVEGLEGNIEWEITGTEASKFQKTVVESTDGNKRISTATITTGNDTEATAQDVTITVSCGGEHVDCSAKIIRVVKVTSIESITTSSTNGKIDAGSNNITVTATVNAGATEELTWSVNTEYQSYVTITKSNPVINTTNNSQTVTLTVDSNIPAQPETALRITAQNESNDVQGTNYVDLTVNIPVSGIKIKKTGESTYIIDSANPPAQIPEITIAPTNGTVSLTAELDPSNASNTGISWTITTNSGVASLSSTTGSNVTVQAGSTKGEVTVTATSVGDTSKTVSVKIKVAEEVGHFKTVEEVEEVGGEETTVRKAYYYPSQNATAEERIEITNNPADSLATNPTEKKEYVGRYLGMKVNYTPTGAKTVSNTTIGTGKNGSETSPTYRLFYVDVNGDYGEEGTIYLKADDDANYASLSALAEATGTTKMQQFNKKWWGDTTKCNNSSYANYDNRKSVNKLLDPSKWTEYKDASGENQIADYVVGAPSLEMWIDSYNAFLRANPVSGKSAYNCTVATSSSGTASSNSGAGYFVGVNGAYTNSGWYTDSSTLVNPSSYTGNPTAADRVEAWNKGSGYYWLASPSAGNSLYVMFVGGSNSPVFYSLCRHRHCVLPASFL